MVAQIPRAGARWRPHAAMAACVVFAAGCSSARPSAISASPIAPAATTSAVTTAVGATTSVAPGSTTVSRPGGTTETPQAETTTASYVENPASSLTWQAVGDGIDAARLEVPLDYANSVGEKATLYVVRHRATDPSKRIGVLVVNPGGPGFAGASRALNAKRIFDPALLARFDIVAWDPRGTGKSVPQIDCIDDYDRFYTSIDRTPQDAQAREVIVERAKEFVAGCVERTGGALPFMGTNNSARDIDRLRTALGEDQISYLGFSYGSELGATWMTLFPDTVRAAVLDGAPDPTGDGRTRAKQQMAGFADAFDRFLAGCSQQGCLFSNGSDPERTYLELLQRLEDQPLRVARNRPPVNRDVAIGAVIYAMYDQSRWSVLDRSLRAAANGDGSGLLALYDRYYQRAPDGTYPNTLEAFRVITCADEAKRESVSQADALEAEMANLAPLLVPGGTAGDYTCTFVDPSGDPRRSIDGGGTAAPIVVLGTTGDPATPIGSTRAMAEALSGSVFVTVTANQHTAYGANRCVVEIVNELFINLAKPAANARC